MTDIATTDLKAQELDTGRPARCVPGQPDMWALVLFEACLFSAYFVVYMVCRVRDSTLYLESQAQLSVGWGVFNTLILLVSSWSIARCVQAARKGAYQAALRNAFLTLFFGLLFVTSKAFEWSAGVQNGYMFTTNEFFSFYYFLTAIHVIHVVVGFVILGVVIYQIWGPKRRSQEIIETGATYWHLVDFLWVIIFALLYLMR